MWEKRSPALAWVSPSSDLPFGMTYRMNSRFLSQAALSVERLTVPDAFGEGGVDFGDVLVGDAPVGPRGVPIPYGEGVRVDASDLYLGL